MDNLLAESVFDAQTSGGLLISLPEQQAQELIDQVAAAGATASCAIGHVEHRQEAAVVLR